MPSRNEKPHVTPTINVNLKPCDCSNPRPRTVDPRLVNDHWRTCAAFPILIHCPIPRSASRTVTLGACGCREEPGRLKRLGESHVFDCPARPIRVACSISGETWKESEVEDVEVVDDPPSGAEWPTFDSARICTERWTLVKALVLGHTDLSALITGPKALEMLTQRDAVFAALAEMHRMESGIIQSKATLDRAYPRSRHIRVMPRFPPMDSDAELAAYVEHLVEQVGVLS